MISPLRIRTQDLKNAIGEDIEKSLSEEDRGQSSLNPSQVRVLMKKQGFFQGQPAVRISVMMCKGGVGKTTTAYFLASRLAAYGARVLAVDADPQGNLTSAFSLDARGVTIDEMTPVLVDVVTKQATLQEALIEVDANLHLLPSTPMNSILDGKIRDTFRNPSVAFNRVFDEIRSKYDFIIFDCAPSLNLTNTAAVTASDWVLLPTSPDKFSTMGLDQTLRELAQIEQDFNLTLGRRILLTRLDVRESVSMKYRDEVVTKYSQWMFQTSIRTATDVKNVLTRNQNLFDIRRSHARVDYDNLCREVLNWVGERPLEREPDL